MQSLRSKTMLCTGTIFAGLVLAAPADAASVTDFLETEVLAVTSIKQMAHDHKSEKESDDDEKEDDEEEDDDSSGVLGIF